MPINAAQFPLSVLVLRHRLSSARRGLVGRDYYDFDAQFSRVEEPVKAKSRLKAGRRTWLTKVIDFIATGVIVLSVLIVSVLFLPEVYYHFVPADTVPIEALEAGTAQGGDFEQGSQASATLSQEERYLPPQNENLPEGDWIIIPRIGVRTELQQTEKPEEALKTGVWHAPDYALPGETDQPMIVAAHRFGWQWWWQSDYWKYNSFYLLPDTEPGDIVEIISDQRKWTYEIYAGTEGEEITDHGADMILYTCKFLNSPVRHFRYARLIDAEANTQG